MFQKPMNFAVLGCGYVADFYMATLAAHPDLSVRGAYDHNPDRTEAFTKHYTLRAYRSLDEVLDDRSVELVLNLTNPRSHFETTSRCLNAGKHVYSEKPIAMESTQAAQLVALAEAKGLRLASAPCSLLSESAQTLWKAVHDGVIGPVRLVYASFDDGMVHRMRPTRGKAPPARPGPPRMNSKLDARMNMRPTS